MDAIEIANKDLQDSYLFIDKVDQQLFKIRGWMLIASSAIIAYGVTNSKANILLVNILLCGTFYFIELIYKTFQNDVIDHQVLTIDAVRLYIKNSPDWMSDYDFGYGKKIKAPTVKRVLKTATHKHMWHIRTIYLLPILFSLGASCLI